MTTKVNKLVPVLIAFVMLFALVLPQMPVYGADPQLTLNGYEVKEAGGGDILTSIPLNTTFDITLYFTLPDSTNDSDFTVSFVSGNFTSIDGNSDKPLTGGGPYTVTFTNIKYSNASSMNLGYSVNYTGGGTTTRYKSLTEAVTTSAPIVSTEPTTVSTAEPPAGSPTFALYSNQVFVVKAGAKTAINVVVQNVSSARSKKTLATIIDEKNIFTFPEGSVCSTSASGYNTTNLGYFIQTPDYTPAGRYPLTLSLSNTNNDGVVSSQSLTIYIDVQSDIKSSTVDVTSYSTDKAAIKPADAFNLNITVKNNTGVALKNVVFALDGLTGDKFAMNTGLASVTLDMAKNEEKTLQFALVGCKGIASIREIIPLKISYYLNPSDKETLKELTTDLTVTCVASTSNDKVFAPNIIIDSYSFGGDYVVGGKAFPLAITIRNTSNVAAIQNLKVTVQGVSGTSTDTGVAFTPANSSNSFFFQNLGVGASENIQLDFLPKADAKPSSYPIQVTFEYEYAANGTTEKAETVTETITIPLQQEDRLTVNPPEVEEMSFVGQECPVSVTLVNKGKSAVYNVSVEVTGEGFDKTEAAYYIGNVDSGKEEYYDVRILPNMEGEIKGEVVVTYEDSNGTQKEIRQEFITNAMQMMMEPMPGVDMPADGINMDGEKKSPVLMIVLIAAGVVVVGAGVFVTLKILKKKKLKAAEVESDDEDI